ncbi:type II toxin-antitoxin system YoeB family toxin, partial [Kingella kingae]|uniref:type II toxin-antitoxin system YoeB family toxin n=1 Tax=Kingella kingae TaxID=504 RepID=UPI0039AF83F8
MPRICNDPLSSCGKIAVRIRSWIRMRLIFSDGAWQDYVYWQTADRKILKRINLLYTKPFNAN